MPQPPARPPSAMPRPQALEGPAMVRWDFRSVPATPVLEVATFFGTSDDFAALPDHDRWRWREVAPGWVSAIRVVATS